jgi:GH15 family glucan-1,4-alpha-glucosidase
MKTYFRALTALLVALALLSFFNPQPIDNSPKRTKLPIMEKLFGASSGNAVVGNGGLTANISRFGELVTLRWPTANFYDHLNYRTLYKVPMSWSAEDYNPYFNASERQGVFDGIQYKQNGQLKISWLRSSEWKIMQGYTSDDAAVVETRFSNASLGIDLVCTDWADPLKDILFRNFKIKQNSGTGITNLSIIHVANLAPCNQTPEFDPGADWADDQKNGFAVVYDSIHESFIAFMPDKKTQGNAKFPEANASASQIQQFANDLDKQFPSQLTTGSSVLQTTDIYCVMSALSAPAAISLYEDNGAVAALPDLSRANGKRFGKGPCLLAMNYTVSAANPEITFTFSFGSNAAAAIKLREESRLKSAELQLQDVLQFWKKKMAQARIPDTHDPGMQKTLQRTLINILLSVNREAGGISSSAGATQPPYSMIWPRDAAFMGYLLDCAGFHEEAERNSLFFVNTQRKNAGEQCYKPGRNECYAGSWFQCYYANGKPSWMYDFEIDEVGFSIWMMYNHALFLEGEKQKTYLRKVYPSIKLAADFLKTFKDEKSGLQKRSREDDLMWESQSSLGAGATLLGLKSAISAARLLNENAGDITVWENRQKELEAAVLKYYWKENTKQFEAAVYGNFGPRGVILWPAMYVPSNDSKADGHAFALQEQMIPFFEKQDKALNTEWWYLGKATLAMGYAWKDIPEKRKIVENDLRIMLNEVCTPDTRIYGETPMVRDINVTERGKTVVKRIYENRVGTPCNIAPAYMYLTAEMLYGNQKTMFDMFVK